MMEKQHYAVGDVVRMKKHIRAARVNGKSCALVWTSGSSAWDAAISS